MTPAERNTLSVAYALIGDLLDARPPTGDPLAGLELETSREIDRIFLHYTAADWDKAGQILVEKLRRYHVDERGWSDIAYHFVVDKTGKILAGRDIDRTPAAQAGNNTGSIAIAYHGARRPNAAQTEAISALTIALVDEHRGATIHGHKEVRNTDCPPWDYRGDLGLNGNGEFI